MWSLYEELEDRKAPEQMSHRPDFAHLGRPAGPQVTWVAEALLGNH